MRAGGATPLGVDALARAALMRLAESRRRANIRADQWWGAPAQSCCKARLPACIASRAWLLFACRARPLLSGRARPRDKVHPIPVSQGVNAAAAGTIGTVRAIC